MVRRPLLTILSLVFASTPASASDGESETCPMWLAPTYLNSINADEFKYGLYAGRTYEKDSVLPLQELAFPLTGFFTQFNKKQNLGDNVLTFLENHVWQEENFGSQWEGEYDSPALVPGIGIHANFHTNYMNAGFLHASVLLREPGEEFPKAGQASLVRGAITPYFNVTLKALEKIQAGMELFAGTSLRTFEFFLES